MADILNLFVGKDKGSRLEFQQTLGTSLLRFDVIEEIDHSMDSQITSTEIEDGSKVSDHVKHNNKKASFKIIVSDGIYNVPNSIETNPIINRLTGLAASVLGSKVRVDALAQLGISKISSLILNKANGEDRSALVFKILEGLRDNSVPITAIFRLRRYENAVITNFSAKESSETAGGLFANITIEEPKIVSSEVVQVKITDVDKEVEQTATKTQDLSKKAVSETSEAVALSSASWLSNIIKFFGA
ncbi:MAG: hypothetical protein GY817_04670 [bacterium]|nr:hypothetical protein [bacterium]